MRRTHFRFLSQSWRDFCQVSVKNLLSVGFWNLFRKENGKQFFLKCGFPPMGTMPYMSSLLYLVGSKCVTKYDVTSNQQPSKNDGKCDLMNISIIFSNLSNIMIAFNPVFFFSVLHRCHINSPSHLNCPLCPQRDLSESSNFSKVCCSSWNFLGFVKNSQTSLSK